MHCGRHADMSLPPSFSNRKFNIGIKGNRFIAVDNDSRVFSSQRRLACRASAYLRTTFMTALDGAIHLTEAISLVTLRFQQFDIGSCQLYLMKQLEIARACSYYRESQYHTGRYRDLLIPIVTLPCYQIYIDTFFDLPKDAVGT